MNQLIHTRLHALNIHNFSVSTVEGTYAGDIYRIHSEMGDFIYKQFDTDRDNERKIYKVLYPVLADVIPLVHNFGDAILMKDLNTSMKHKTIMHDDIVAVLEVLKSIHFRTYPAEVTSSLPNQRENHIELRWLKDQAKQLKHPSINDIYQSLERIYDNLIPLQLELQVTHGDCHLDNIFVDDKVYLIDWERAALASLVRDITMFLMDIEGVNIQRYKQLFYDIIKEYEICEEEYTNDFNHYMAINTVKMMVWEIGKYNLDIQSKASMLENVQAQYSQLSSWFDLS